MNLPPYARTPYRVAGISDIEKRGRMLFGDQGGASVNNSVSSIKRLIPKPDKNASFVAAWFLRRMAQEQILPAQRKEIIAVDKKFFETRRAVFSDDRLSRKDKAQYVSVLTFERLKAHHAITKPDIPFEQESPDMGSADIRKLIKETRIPDNSISGAPVDDKDIPPARERFSRIIDNINDHMAEKRRRDRQRAISAADLYTKRARLSKNVHYLDKRTDRTLFVDTGKSIALRKHGMTDSAVLVALELAKEKFGSTLTIKGSKAFREQVIDVVAKNNLDIHFTDKAMNKALEARREELAIEKEGQRIEQPEAADAGHEKEDNREREPVSPDAPDAAPQEQKEPAQKQPVTDNTPEGDPDGQDETANAPEVPEQPAAGVAPDADATGVPAKQGRDQVHYGVLLEHGAAPYRFKPNMNKPEDERDDNYYVKLKLENGKTRTLWGVGLQDAVQGLRAGDHTRFEDKGTERVNWTETRKDGTTVEKSGDRRIWEAEPTDWARQQERKAELNPDHNTDGPDVA